MRALTADRQALAVPQAPIAGQIHQPFDVHRGVAAKIAFDHVLGIDGFADVQHFLVRQVRDALGRIDPQLVCNLAGLEGTDAVNVGQRNNHALVSGDIYPRNTSHLVLHAPQGTAVPRAPISTPQLRRTAKSPAGERCALRLPDYPRISVERRA